MSQAFGLGRARTISGPVARGELGEIRRLDTDRGTWAVKRRFAPDPDPEIETSAAYHRQCWEAGVPTPEPIRAVSGTFAAEVRGESLQVYSWVDLEEPATDLDPVAVGEVVAALHAVRRRPEGSVADWFEAPIGASEWARVLEESREAEAPYADRLAELLPALIEVESILSPMAGSQTCHSDLWAENLRRTSDGNICVIDFDNAGPADPGREVAMVVFEFGRVERYRARRLYDAYQAAGGAGRVRGRDSWAMTVAQLHHIGHRHLRMWLTARTEDARRRSLSGVEEFLGEPLLLSHVDRMLAELF